MIKKIRKSLINTFPVLAAFRNKMLIDQTIRQFDIADFNVEKEDGWYKIKFNNQLGYDVAELNPAFRFDHSTRSYEVIVNGRAFLTKTFPLPEIIRELRGYLLAGVPLKDKAIIDIGASNGFISMAMACFLDTGKMFALEPDAYYRKSLNENLSLNNFGNIVVSNKCIYSKNGTFRFVSNGDGSSSLIDGPGSGEMIEAETLDTFLKGNHITSEQVGLLKMDIEGAEIAILDDIINFLKKNYSAVVAIASYHMVNGRMTCDIIEEKVRSVPGLIAKTAYPYHRTTFITHEHSSFAQRLNHLKPL